MLEIYLPVVQVNIDIVLLLFLSLLVGVFIPIDLFPSFVTQSLLFLSFIVATFLPLLIIKAKKLHIS